MLISVSSQCYPGCLLSSRYIGILGQDVSRNTDALDHNQACYLEREEPQGIRGTRLEESEFALRGSGAILTQLQHDTRTVSRDQYGSCGDERAKNAVLIANRDRHP